MSFMSDICLSALKLLKANAQASFALPPSLSSFLP